MMTFVHFKDRFWTTLVFLFGIQFHLKTSGQQKLCSGSIKKYSVDTNLIINKNETYNWHIDSKDFKGTIISTNEYGNEVEIDWKNSGTGIYKLEVSKTNSCSTVFSILQITLEDQLEIDMPTLYFLCPNEKSLKINAPNGYQIYHWYNSKNQLISKEKSIDILEEGSYSLNISDGHCETMIKLDVFLFAFPDLKILNTGINTIFIQLNDLINDFEFQLEDSKNKIIRPWQKSTVFENIPEGEYLINIKSKTSSCFSTIIAQVFAIPNFITPNGDGYNDYWDLTAYQNIRSILIFDRYGKNIKSFIHPEVMKWDGKINNRVLASDNYWYQIELNDNQIIKGSITIKN